MKNYPKTWIDLFAGGGGTTSGAMMVPGIKVLAALNHDPISIETHSKNHPETKHFQADIREQDEKKLPRAKGLWASLECTNFSNAKGGAPREADSRTLAWELPRYAKHCNPDYIIIENVREFMSWGDLDHKGKPVSRTSGLEYLKWVNHMKTIGYVNYDYRMLNSADYGAYTSRTRYFGIFSKKNCDIKFPSPTHAKTPGLLDLKKWNACKEKIDLNNKGKSIFTRKKPLVENTIKRIEAGINKFYPDLSFIMKYYGSGENVTSLDEPVHTITTKDRHAVVQLKEQQFITDHCWTDSAQKISEPLKTVLTWQTKQLVTVEEKHFITSQYNSTDNPGANVSSIENPVPTITTRQKHSLVTVGEKQFLTSHYNSSGNPGSQVSSLENPCPTIMTANKHSLVTVSGKHYDVFTRFLNTNELSLLSGFPEDYKFCGSTQQQIKQIGNAVVPIMAKVLIESLI